MIPILEKEHLGCSFVAIGAQGISPDGRQEQIENTQRYLTYKRILFKLFENASNYALIDSNEHSALLMMNILEFVEDENYNFTLDIEHLFEKSDVKNREMFKQYLPIITTIEKLKAIRK